MSRTLTDPAGLMFLGLKAEMMQRERASHRGGLSGRLSKPDKTRRERVKSLNGAQQRVHPSVFGGWKGSAVCIAVFDGIPTYILKILHSKSYDDLSLTMGGRLPLEKV